MLSEKVLFALNNVNDASLEQARRLLDRSVVSQRQAGRKIIRTFLIAAILAALMAATAYAIVSIHQKRQEELREKYKPAENHLTTYVEYSAPEETSDTITLLSAYNNGEVQTVYMNVKPVEQEEVRSIFMQDQQEDGRLYHLSYQFAIDDGEMNGWAEFLYPFEPERNYDPDSKTLSLSLSFRPTDYPDQDRFSIHLCSFDNWQTVSITGRLKTRRGIPRWRVWCRRLEGISERLKWNSSHRMSVKYCFSSLCHLIIQRLVKPDKSLESKSAHLSSTGLLFTLIPAGSMENWIGRMKCSSRMILLTS